MIKGLTPPYAAIVYGTKSKILRRIIKFESRPDESWVQDEESVIFTEWIDGMAVDLSIPKGLIEEATGVYPPSERCCVINSEGTVINIIQADPEIDSVEGMTLVSSEQAGIGWRWNPNNGFSPPCP